MTRSGRSPGGRRSRTARESCTFLAPVNSATQCLAGLDLRLVQISRLSWHAGLRPFASHTPGASPGFLSARFSGNSFRFPIRKELPSPTTAENQRRRRDESGAARLGNHGVHTDAKIEILSD